ncbi:hypothetical protein SAMN02982929_00802 [Saccharopolyspora kobensis]|uniref:Uncharacterized protein n=1 Tax=Saccharopolyspora kobensis TaxID=146035 RepID=A0A1H5V8B8_9PSEU|nr:hypothetical protein [Saccharopolyspora kobensis]SEF83599.1 hypothetical protein SAMN02982929_00802 [Saccharopolyspora kobensis]SFC63829.1 hypothetical protein SAMN05216506_1011268 [Saccharopolyspora kobensis]
MRTLKVGEREIEVVDFEDVTVPERVIEFRFIDDHNSSSFAAVVVPEGGDWSSAVLSVDPKFGEFPAALMAALMEVAREIIEAN